MSDLIKESLIKSIKNKDLTCFSVEELKKIENYIQLLGERKIK